MSRRPITLDFAGRQWQPQAFAVCMAFDAFRIAIGAKPRTFAIHEVLRWLEARIETGLA